jgi:bacterioferritin-associated ferredoxin
MIVCLCKVVSDRQIQAAIDSGARSVEAVGASCRAGTGCGACHDSIEEMIGACAGCPAARYKVPSAYLEASGDNA